MQSAKYQRMDEKGKNASSGKRRIMVDTFFESFSNMAKFGTFLFSAWSSVTVSEQILCIEVLPLLDSASRLGMFHA